MHPRANKPADQAGKTPVVEKAPPGFVAPSIGTVVYVPRIKIPFQKTLPVVDIAQGKVKGPMLKAAVPIQFRVVGRSVPAVNVFRNRADAMKRATQLADEYIAERTAEIESVRASLNRLTGKRG